MTSISVCMIVRDEEAVLARCLGSIEGIADEIIIVDTGSQDGTKAIANEFGAKVFDFEWVDDFAAARNESFRHATRDYLLWLDADDVLLPEDRAKLLQLKATLGPGVDAVSMRYNTAFDAFGNVVGSARRLRLVRRSAGFEWFGMVHEDLEGPPGFTLLDSDIVVTHRKPGSGTGPSPRNLEIYEKHLRAGRPMRSTDVFHYARELQMNRHFEAAIIYHRQFLESGQPTPELALFTLHNLATCCHMVGDLDGEWQCTLQSLEFDVPRPEFSCRIAERFLAKQQYYQAIFWYEQALNYQPAGPTGQWAIDHHAYKTWVPHKQLAFCYFHIGDYASSLRHNRSARNYLPDDPEIITNIVMLEQLTATD